MKSAFLLFALLFSCHAQSISGERIRAHVKFLSSDLLEGRGVGGRGGELATEYIAPQFSLSGGQTAPDATLSAVAAGGKDASFRWLEDFVGVDRRQQLAESFDAEA